MEQQNQVELQSLQYLDQSSQKLEETSSLLNGAPMNFYEVKKDQNSYKLDPVNVQFVMNDSNQAQQQQQQNKINYNYPQIEEEQLINYSNDALKQQQNNQTPLDKDEIPFIVHKVKPMDTLIGISIQYGVPENKIKVYNNLNTDDIYYVKELKIPNPTTNIVSDLSEKDMEEVLRNQKLAYFKNCALRPKDQSDKVARFYLEDNEWNFQKAEKAYISDLKWEEQYEKQNPHGQLSSKEFIDMIQKKEKLKQF